eukprot:gene6633-10798_t
MTKFNSEEWVRNWTKLWSESEGEKLQNLFSKTGTYFDPSCKLISIEKIPTMISSLRKDFPDHKFKCLNCFYDEKKNYLTVNWMMSGNFFGYFELKGVDLIQFNDEFQIEKAETYFDMKVFLIRGIIA